MNRDFAEILKALAAESVEFLVVGEYAVAGHGIPRATGDIDLWIRPTAGNAARLGLALERFGAPRSRLSPELFTQRDVVYQIGLPPNRIDFLTTIDGVIFDDAWAERVPCVVSGIAFNMLSLRHLVENKRATGSYVGAFTANGEGIYTLSAPTQSGNQTLTFTQQVDINGVNYGQLVIVPEPVMLGLLGIAGGVTAMGLRRFRLQRRKPADAD